MVSGLARRATCSSPLRPKRLPEALVAARGIRNAHPRATALSAVAPRMSEEDRETVLQEALAIAQRIGDEHYQARVLGALAERLSTADREMALREGLALIREIHMTGSGPRH